MEEWDFGARVKYRMWGQFTQCVRPAGCDPIIETNLHNVFKVCGTSFSINYKNLRDSHKAFKSLRIMHFPIFLASPSLAKQFVGSQIVLDM